VLPLSQGRPSRAGHMTGRFPAVARTFMASFMVSIIFGAGSAIAGCAEDLTRIQLAMPSARPNLRPEVADLVATAGRRAKANDATACATATAQALKLLGLPELAPITLSTPVPGVDRQPHPPGAGSQAANLPIPPPSTDGARVAPPATSAKPDETAPADWYVSTSNIVGRDVTARDHPDDTIGSIRALVIDSTTRQTVLALVETGGILGFGGKLVAVPFAAVQFFGRWDRPMIRASLATLQSAPRVTTADVPGLVSNAAWRAALAKHFNVEIAAPSGPSVASSTDATVVRPAAVTDGAAGDPVQGRSYAQGICAACHTFDQGGGTRVGPNLYGVVDSKIAAAPGYSYSTALQDHGGNWNAANLDGFLKNPQAFAPGTTMPFSGISSPSERRNVIAYLASLGHVSGGPK